MLLVEIPVRKKKEKEYLVWLDFPRFLLTRGRFITSTFNLINPSLLFI